jgi:hypothetical protein
MRGTSGSSFGTKLERFLDGEAMAGLSFCPSGCTSVTNIMVVMLPRATDQAAKHPPGFLRFLTLRNLFPGRLGSSLIKLAVVCIKRISGAEKFCGIRSMGLGNWLATLPGSAASWRVRQAGAGLGSLVAL